MADTEDVVQLESTASPEVQARAEKMGWIPPSRYKGDPERYVDADLYIERGETVLPIVKKHNKELTQEVDRLKAESKELNAALKRAQDAIEAIEERHSVETQKAVENARRELKAQLASASEAGDHSAVAEITDQLTQLKTAEKDAKEKKPDPLPTYTPPPELVEWNRENPWYGKDKRKTALALGIAQELRDNGETTQGRAFFDLVAAEVEKELGGRREPVDKVEGGRNGSDADTRQAGGRKSYASLPADAKAACDADMRKFVGEGKRYKTPAEWRSRYAELYFEGQ